MDVPVRPPDTILRVARSDGDGTLHLRAVPTKGPHALQGQDLGSLPSEAQLLDLSANVRKAMEDAPFARVSFESVLREQGQALWDSLPAGFQEFYRDYLFSNGITSIEITGVPAHLPWELIWPQDSMLPNNVREHMFGVSFAVTRRPSLRLPGSITIESLDIIAPRVAANPGTPLTLPGGLLREIELLKEVFPGHWTEGSSVEDLGNLLRNPRPRILHLSAHGTPDVIHLEERPLQRQELVAEGLGRFSEPTLVFLNACRTGAVSGSAATDGVESWADAFIQLGCSACVAPLWLVLGQIAEQVSVKFYRDLRQGVPLGRAMQERRRTGATVEGEQRFFPTWFAYVVYGHPNAQVHFAE